ncbi:MAG: hypothetical protein AB1434_08550 [Pseudomonadota bacterium]
MFGTLLHSYGPADGTAQNMKLSIARERVGRIAVQYTKENKV